MIKQVFSGMTRRYIVILIVLAVLLCGCSDRTPILSPQDTAQPESEEHVTPADPEENKGSLKGFMRRIHDYLSYSFLKSTNFKLFVFAAASSSSLVNPFFENRK